MANMRRKLGGIVGVTLALLIVAAALPDRAGATLWTKKLEFTHVNPNGIGGALIWPMFTVTNTNTLLTITNTTTSIAGVDSVSGETSDERRHGSLSINSIGRFVLVHFHVRKDTDSTDLRDWTVCLSPGDVWGAAFVSSGGGADTKIETSDLSTTNVAFPLTISGQTQGYIEAVAVDTGTSKAKGCDGIVPNAGGAATGDVGFRMVNSLFGEGFFVSLGNGIASGYNATAIGTFQDVRGFETVVNTIHTAVAPDTTTKGANKRVFFALAHPGLAFTVGSLDSRWILDNTIGLDTQMVITFPVGGLTLFPNKDLGFGGSDVCADCFAFDFSIPATMAFWARDDEENLAQVSPRQVTIGKELNVLTLSSLVAAEPALIPGGATGGWFRLMVDADENQFVDAIAGDTCSVAGSPATPCALAGGGTGVIQHHFVPAMLPVTGFTILTGFSGSTKLSALLPWKSEPPADLYDCGAALGSLACSGRTGVPGTLDLTP